MYIKSIYLYENCIDCRLKNKDKNESTSYTYVSSRKLLLMESDKQTSSMQSNQEQVY